jgi:hypothetical protein
MSNRTATTPDIIYMPDPSRPAKPKRKGRHFGPRPVDDPRSERIDLRVTPKQRAGIKAAAQTAGLSVSAFICLQTLGDPGPRAGRAKPGPDMLMLGKVLAALGSNRGNTNQIAKRLNAYDFTGHPELIAMRDGINAAAAAMKAASQTIIRAIDG